MQSVDTSIIIRVQLSNDVGALSKVTGQLAEQGCSVGAIDIVKSERGKLTRDFTVFLGEKSTPKNIEEALNALDNVQVINISDRTFLMHLGGKVEVKSKFPLKTRDELSMAYTPGVARVCMAIHEKPEKAFKLTIKNNTVAVVTDGTAVLGLGDIGPEAAMPVMEGKAMLFKDFAGVNAFPVALDTKDVEEIIRTVKVIAPGFGGINLEDIAAPRCFEIEKRLKAELDIPVFHDDQHGTAIVCVAALINALKIVKKKPQDLKVAVNGVGAAGVACTDMLLHLGVKNIIGCDREGAIYKERTDLDDVKCDYVKRTNPNNEKGCLSEIIKGADVFIGVSAPNVLTVDDLKAMNKDPIIFAMANPDPEIKPELAWDHVAIMATGRSDYPNQINNVLAFPGIFKGALACQATDINEEMKQAAAYAIANLIEESELSPDYIVPSVFDKRIADAVSEAVIVAARDSGIARR